MLGKRVISYIDAVTDVIDIEVAKKHLEIVRQDQDVLLELYLGSAINACSNYLGFSIRRATVDYFYTDVEINYSRARGGLSIPSNVLSLTGVYYRNEALTETEIDAADYDFWNVEHIPVIKLLETPTSYANQGWVYKARVIEGYYTQGHGSGDARDTIPDDVYTAILLTLTHHYENRNNVGIVQTYPLAMGAEHFLYPYSKLQIL